jgi:hypothetical protein
MLAMPGALADEYACKSLAGDPPVTLDFSLRYSSGAYAVMSAAFQIEGDIGYSTTATEPTDLATVTGVEISADEVRFKLHYADATYDGDIATIHVVTLAEGEHTVTAGALHVLAGGLWPVQCEINYEG